MSLSHVISNASRARALSDLRECYPLPLTSPLEVHESSVDVGGESVYLAGLAVTLEGDVVLTGAAADSSAIPWERSYFELVERLALVEAGLQRLVDDELQRASLSNGVALHQDEERARCRARWELIERDHVLRSFYGGSAPQRVALVDGVVPRALSARYTIESYGFPGGIGDSEVEVAGVFAFPRDSSAPFGVGFAARPRLVDAVVAAGRELLQQIGFGWGEPSPEAAPAPAPTPEFHLDHFAYAPHRVTLREWLDGGHVGRGPELPSAAGEFRYRELTPPWLAGRLSVMQAEHPSAVPLVFGHGHPWFPSLPENMRVHPIA